MGRGKVFAALSAAIVVLVAIVVTRHRSLPSAPSAHAADASVTAFQHSFTPGRHLTYAFDLTSDGLVDGTLERRASLGENAAGAVLRVTSSIEGTLETTVLERGQDGSARVLVVLRDVEIAMTVADRDVPLPRSALAPLERGFVVEYARDGAVLGLRMPEGSGAASANVAAQVASLMQLVVPEDGAQSWRTSENDSLGPLTARYRYESDEPSLVGDRVVSKSIERHVAPRARGALGRLLAAGGTSSRADLAFEVSPAKGELTFVAGALQTDHALGDVRVGSEDSTVLIELRSEEVVSKERRAELERGLDVGERRPLDPAALAAEQERAEQERVLSQVDVDAIVADARRNPPATQSAEAFTYGRILRAAIALSPSHRSKLEAVLREPRVPEEVFLPVARAFADVGSAEAQAALGRVIDQRPPRDPGREVALVSLARVEAPTPETVKRIVAMSEDPREPLRDAAILSLGRVAGELVIVDPSRGEPLVTSLLGRLRAAENDERRVLWLDALGNAGAPQAAPALAEALHAPSPSVRAAAAGAYRLDPSPGARATLLGAMTTDGDATVRYAAMEAVLLRRADEGIVDAVASRVETDGDERVRKPALSRLLSLCRRSPRACDHLERLKVVGDTWTRHELASFQRP